MTAQGMEAIRAEKVVKSYGSTRALCESLFLEEFVL